MKKIEHVPFRKSYFNLSVSDKGKPEKKANTKQPELHIAKIAAVNSTGQYQGVLDKVFKAVKTKQYNSVKNLFTNNGYDAFIKLLQYGNARILDKSNIRYLSFNDEVLARSATMAFSFANNKKFVEDVG